LPRAIPPLAIVAKGGDQFGWAGNRCLERGKRFNRPIVSQHLDAATPLAECGQDARHAVGGASKPNVIEGGADVDHAVVAQDSQAVISG
jgi:hypothetical protein